MKKSYTTALRYVLIYHTAYCNIDNCTTYSLTKILQTNENSRGAQTLLTSNLLICNWNFVSYSRMHFCCLRKSVFNSWTVLEIGVSWLFSTFTRLLWNCVQCLVVRTTSTCVKQPLTALHCMQRSIGDRKTVCPSVCLSVHPSNACTCGKTKLGPS